MQQYTIQFSAWCKAGGRALRNDTAKLFAAFFILFLFIYGAMIVKHGYMSDELVDFCGGHLKSYRANGRWFIALWRYTFGVGANSVAAGLTSGLLLASSLILLTKSIGINHFFERLIFGFIYLIHFQFAYVMEYSFQSDVTAFGILCIAVASFFIQKKTIAGQLISLLMLAIALSIYQALIFNYFILIAFITFNHVKKEQWLDSLKIILKAVGCCVFALILHSISRKIVVEIVPTDEGIIKACEAYQADFNVAAKIGISNLTGLAGQAVHTIIEFWKNVLYPTKFPGEWIYSTAIIPVAILVTKIWKKQSALSVKIVTTLLLISIWILPFSLMLVFLNPDCMDVHNRLGESLSLSCLWVLAIPQIKWSQLKIYLFFIVIGLLAVKSANYVNTIANKRRGEFEARLSAFKQMEFEGAKMASSAGIPISKDNIILFFYTGKDYYLHNHIGDYPAIIYMRMARTQDELTNHRAALDAMTSWPEMGSIKVDKGKVLIKTGYSSYRKEEK